jgi:hypothetical protein
MQEWLSSSGDREVVKVFYVVDYPKNMMLYTSKVETCYVVKLNGVHLLEGKLLQL